MSFGRTVWPPSWSYVGSDEWYLISPDRSALIEAQPTDGTSRCPLHLPLSVVKTWNGPSPWPGHLGRLQKLSYPNRRGRPLSVLCYACICGEANNPNASNGRPIIKRRTGRAAQYSAEQQRVEPNTAKTTTTIEDDKAMCL